MDIFTDYGSFQVVLKVALFALPILVVLFLVNSAIIRTRVKRMGIDPKPVKVVKKEYETAVEVLEWKKAMEIGVRDLFVWESIRTGNKGMESLVHTLASTGLEIELVPEVEGCTDSIEKTDLDCAKFRKIMNRMLVRTHGESYKNESI